MNIQNKTLNKSSISGRCFFTKFSHIDVLIVTLLIGLKPVFAIVELTADQIREEIVKAEIIPDVILQPPQNVLQITYPKWFVMKRYVNFGTIIPVSKLQLPPISIHWPYEEGAYYTLILTSPDAPSRIRPSLREWQHWVVGNIRKNDVENGKTLTEYKAPGFVRNTGLHRLVFLVFKQPNKLAFTERNKRKRVYRSFFSTNIFSLRYKLGAPVAGNYIQVDCGPPASATENPDKKH